MSQNYLISFSVERSVGQYQYLPITLERTRSVQRGRYYHFSVTSFFLASYTAPHTYEERQTGGHLGGLSSQPYIHLFVRHSVRSTTLLRGPRFCSVTCYCCNGSTFAFISTPPKAFCVCANDLLFPLSLSLFSVAL